MKRIKFRKGLAVCLLAFWFFAVLLEQAAKEWSLETLLCDSNPAGQQLFTRSGLEADKKMQAAAWSREAQVLVENHSLDRKEYVDCISIWSNATDGITDILSGRLSGGRLLAGTYGFAGDEKSCWISSSLALELFGSVDVYGKWIWCKEGEKRIQGVIKGNQNQIWVLAPEDETFPYLLLKDGNREEKRSHIMQQEKIREWISHSGISGEYVTISGNRFYCLVRFLSCIPVWVLFLCLLRRYRHVAAQEKIKSREVFLTGTVWLKWAVLIVCGFAMCCFLWMLLEYSLWLPYEFVPARWSDFGFYAEKAREIHKNIQDIRRLLPVTWYESWKKVMGAVLVCSICASFGIKRLCT